MKEGITQDVATHSQHCSSQDSQIEATLDNLRRTQGETLELKLDPRNF